MSLYVIAYMYVTTYIDVCLYTYLNKCMQTYTCIYRYIHVCNMCIYVPPHTYICPCMVPRYMCTYMHIYMCVCLYMHAIYIIILYQLIKS